MGLPYPERAPQGPNDRHNAERADDGEARCDQVDDGGENDFAAPLQRAVGRSVGALRCRMPHAHGVSSFLVMISLVARGACPVGGTVVLLPMALTLGPQRPPVHPTKVRRPPQLRGVGSRHVSPSPPEHRVMGHMWSRPPPRTITRQRTRCQSDFNPTLHVWVGVSLLCRAVLDDVDTVLFQHTPNLLNILHIHAGNTDTALDPTVTMLKNFDLKRDAVQTKNNFPAQ